jgi:hypothetical protein
MQNIQIVDHLMLYLDTTMRIMHDYQFTFIFI